MVVSIESSAYPAKQAQRRSTEVRSEYQPSRGPRLAPAIAGIVMRHPPGRRTLDQVRSSALAFCGKRTDEMSAARRMTALIHINRQVEVVRLECRLSPEPRPCCR